METPPQLAHPHQLPVIHLFPPKPTKCFMTPPTISFNLFPPPHHFRRAYLRFYAAVLTPFSGPSRNHTKRLSTAAPRVKKQLNIDTDQLKLNWRDSLSGASLSNSNRSDSSNAAEPGWVIGIDPDLSGALAVLKPDNSPQVFDTPHLKMLVGTRVRRRLDARSIIQLLQTIDAPIGTTAYLEQSIPFPQDGKQGWWSGGFGYGLWIGILVASGYTVVPVPSVVWKNEFKLSGNRACKDDSRELASALFPSLSSLLSRKKDHGRAEALLLAAYGKGIKATRISSFILEDTIPKNQDLQALEHDKLEAALSFPEIEDLQGLQLDDFEAALSFPENQDLQALEDAELEAALSFPENQDLQVLEDDELEAASFPENQEVQSLEHDELEAALSFSSASL